MNKFKTLALAGLVVVSSTAIASSSREGGFGQAARFISDSQQIFTYTAATTNYANTMFLEFGVCTLAPATTPNDMPNKQWGGANLSLGPGVLAVWTGRNTAKYAKTQAIAAVVAPSTGAAPAFGTCIPKNIVNQAELIYAFNLSDTLALGIGINKGVVDGTNSVETANTATSGTALLTTKDETGAGDFGVSLGADIKGLGAIDLLQIGFSYSSAGALSRKDAQVVSDIVTNKNTIAASEIAINVGGDIKGEKGAFHRFEVMLNTQDEVKKLEYKDAPAADSYIEGKAGYMGWGLGWATGMSSDKGMGLLGLTLGGSSSSLTEPNKSAAKSVDKNDIGTLGLDVVAGGEVKVKEWLQARAGISNSLWNNKTTVSEIGIADTAGGITKVTTNAVASKNATLSAGLSFLLGDITIDGVLNQDVLYSGTWLLSGSQENISTNVSASWNFGGSKE